MKLVSVVCSVPYLFVHSDRPHDNDMILLCFSFLCGLNRDEISNFEQNTKAIYQ